MKNFFVRWKKLKNKINMGLLVLMTIASLIMGIYIGFQYIAVILTVALLVVLSKQAEKEEMIMPKEKEEAEIEIKKLEKKIEVIKEHIEKNEDNLEAKFQLIELEQQLDNLKKKYFF